VLGAAGRAEEVGGNIVPGRAAVNIDMVLISLK
jgi:hypothetical protein